MDTVGFWFCLPHIHFILILPCFLWEKYLSGGTGTVPSQIPTPGQSEHPICLVGLSGLSKSPMEAQFQELCWNYGKENLFFH